MRPEKLTYVGGDLNYWESVRFGSAPKFKNESNYRIAVGENPEFTKEFKIFDFLMKQPEHSRIYLQEFGTYTENQSLLKTRGVSLARLLKVGSLCVAAVSLETLLFLVLGIPEFGILNPFAALLFLIASPFFFWMGRLARY